MKNEIYNLSNTQKNIWLVEQHFSNSNVNNIVGKIEFKEKINIEILKEAINLVVQKNDALRFKMKYMEGKLIQYISEYIKFDVEVLQIENEKEYLNEFSSYIFDITNESLFHFEIIINSHGQTKLISRFHHIITDAWSLSLISTEIINFYNNLINNESIPEKDYYSYTQYIKEECNYASSDKYFKDQNYWNEIYSDEPQILNLNSDIKKLNTSANRYIKIINNENSNKIKAFCSDNRISEYCLFLTALQIYISRKYNIDDVIIGNPFLNRRNHNEKQSIGIFVNTLPVRMKIDYEISIKELLKKNSLIILNALKHEQYPYNDILEYVKTRHSINQNLYNILFSYQNAKDICKKEGIKYSTEWIFHNNIADNLEIHIHDRNQNGTYNIVYDYQQCLFSEDNIKRLNESYLRIIEQIIDGSNKKINDFSIISKKEEKVILKDFNEQKINLSAYYRYKNIVNLIGKFKYSTKIALQHNNEYITYKELNIRVNKLVTYLKNNLKFEEKENIGIIAEKNIDTIVAILAIIKMNCTFVPIDPMYPEKRKEYMISNADIKKILYCNHYEGSSSKIKIDISYKNYINEKEKKYKFNYDLNDNLYIIYTSGSTGNPKPVTITHKNIINLIMNELLGKEIKFTKKTHILQFATLSFDVSYQEIFSAFLSGSTLVLIDDMDKKDSNSLLNCIIDNKIDILFIPPRYLEILAENEIIQIKDIPLKHIITAGEQLLISSNIEKLINKGITIHNHYGPAETHVATTYVINKENITKKPPIGKAIKNTNVYILDKSKHLCPVNTIGEIYISGDCVGNGYFNNKKLTNERFIRDPFNKNYIMYKTGDLGKLDNNGNIYYLGRADFQVKINGYRIELEEVEKGISKINQIQNVSVSVDENGEKKTLESFIKFKEKMTIDELRNELVNYLPLYMIPNKFYIVDKIPLNQNGKSDKKYLQENKNNYKLLSSNNKKVLPQNMEETKILKAMQFVLKMKEISVLDDFFEVGGDSLLAISLQIELSKNDIVLNTQEIYDNPTARNLSNYIREKQKEEKNSQYEKIELHENLVSIKNENNILLTGATGFLGSHILNYLLENTKSYIYCIIRNKKNISAENRLKDIYNTYFNKNIDTYLDDRLFIIQGDLIKENFGLENEQYVNLQSKIDIIINVAASVKHYGKRDYNFEHNVVSIKHIAQFAKNRTIPINHISTIGIAGNNLVNTNECIKDTFSENDLIIGQKYEDNVYLSTKLQAEKMLIENIKKGISTANIIRVGNLMNRYNDNVFQINKETNAFQNKISEIIKLGYITNEMKDFSFDITPVDMCAEAIVKLSLYNKYNNVYHVLNNKEITINEILEILKENGINLEYRNSFEKNDIEKSKWLINDYLLNNKKKIKIESNKTIKLLNELGFSWKIDKKYYMRVISSIVKGAKDE